MSRNRPRVLIEQWLPIADIGAECMRDASAAKKPPLNRLHVWWARRPLTISRAAVLASLLPAYSTVGDDDIRPWPAKLLKRFPTFDAYKAWFLRLLGIHGDPVAGRKVLDWANKTGTKLKFNAYGYPRSFTITPSDEQIEVLYDLIEWTWGTKDVTVCDPMAGGGSIPFEALRFGLTVRANELNPVASVILKGTLQYPPEFGASLVADGRRYGKLWCEKIRERLERFYPQSKKDENIFGFIWARTVSCPATGKPVPLLPNLWLRKGQEPAVLCLVANPDESQCRFRIIEGAKECAKAKPDHGTIKRGTAVSPWTGETIPGDYIKSEARAGRMSQVLCAIATKQSRTLTFRLPSEVDECGVANAEAEVKRSLSSWELQGLLPTEPRREGRADWACAIYGIKHWHETYTPRQLLAMVTYCDVAQEVFRIAEQEAEEENLSPERLTAIKVLLSIVIAKAADYNSMQTTWNSPRCVISHSFGRHDLSMRWSFGEYDAARGFAPWLLEQVLDATEEIGKLAHQPSLFAGRFPSPSKRLRITNGPAQDLAGYDNGSVKVICVDPPYYDNVNYAECSNYFYIWHKRVLRDTFPDLFESELTNEDDEAIMNPARFRDAGRKRKELAIADYENKMMLCFREMHRVLADDGVLSVMFTHKQVDAWDTLGMALIRAGFHIDASFPVNTEFIHSLHQAQKNAAASTIILACRKREKSGVTVWWDDLKSRVRAAARQKATEFEAQGIRGVDLYISTFGPVLSIISENWPVLTSETDPKTGDPLPLKPGEALDLARQEVVNLRKQGLLLGRSVEFDPVTDWYLMAWDAFRAQEFPADEARKLALALGLDLEQDLVKGKRLVTKKSARVVLSLPADRRKKGMVDEDADTFPHLIDALHTAMMIYDEEGSKACQVFVDRQGLRTDSRTKALVQAMMEAIPTTRDKAGKFLRPEMTTLDALRMLFWDDLPAPKEEEPPKLDPQMKLAGFDDEEVEGEEMEEETEDEEE